MKKKLRGSAASYIVDKENKLFRCDVKKLARIYSKERSVPKTLGMIRQMEIQLLAQAYLRILK